MPVLQWVGKDKVVNHHYDVPFRLLKKQYSFQAKDGSPKNSTNNRIIHGDNLEALKSLLPEFEGKINCIYIDPPYNTGNEGWVYNDNVNDPKIKKWLGEVVGKEGEDLSRHDKWLCMMYPRLKLLHRLLANDGIIFISIDDNEYANLKLIMDEVFGRSKRLETFAWRTDGNFDNQAKIKNCHEYILMYSKKPELFPFPNLVDPNTPAESKLFKPIIKNTIVKNGPKNPVSNVVIPIGFPTEFEVGQINARVSSWPHYLNDCNIKDFKTLNEVEVSSGWSSLDLLLEYIANGFNPILDSKGQETSFIITKTGAIEVVKIRNNPSHVITSLMGLGNTQSASSALEKLGIKFPFPKPVSLIRYLLQIVSPGENKEFIILDSFAGTCSTAEAALLLNTEDGGNRRFICIEMMDYAETITAERVRRVINGYGEGSKAVNGLGGGFDFYTVDAPLFLESNNLNEAVGVEVIRNYVAYTERLEDFHREIVDNKITPYGLGLKDNALYVFYYERDRITTLDMAFLGELPVQSLSSKPEQYIIYADKCALEKEFMLKHGITFKRIPRDISRF